MKDESRHSTGTFKERLARVAVASSPPCTLFGAISYGNTALSFATLLRELRQNRRSGHSFVAFVPEGIDAWQFGPSTSGARLEGQVLCDLLRHLGCYVIEIDLTRRTYGDNDLQALATEHGVPGAGRFQNVTEGISTPAYAAIAEEAVEQLGRPPDVCIVQFGAGILCNEVKDTLDPFGTRVVPISVPSPHSIARMLYGPAWLNVERLSTEGRAWSRHYDPDRTGRRRVPYEVYRVSEVDLRAGLEVARRLDLSCEPSGSAGLGFLSSLPQVFPDIAPKTDTVLVVNTGNGIDVANAAWVAVGREH